jgi:hypothetical protein
LDLMLRVRYTPVGGGPGGEGEATDVSPHGLRVESKSKPTPGQRLDVELDDGSGQSEKGAGAVTWCRPRQTASGKTVHEFGLRLDEDWLTGERGPLGKALAKLFAQAAKDFGRIHAEARVGQGEAVHRIPLTVSELSEKGLRVTLAGETSLPPVKVGEAVRVSLGEVEVTMTVEAREEHQSAGAGGHSHLSLSAAPQDEAARKAAQDVMALLGRDPTAKPVITLHLA